MLEVSYPIQETEYKLTHALLFYRSYSETLATRRSRSSAIGRKKYFAAGCGRTFSL